MIAAELRGYTAGIGHSHPHCTCEPQPTHARDGSGVCGWVHDEACRLTVEARDAWQAIA